MIVEDDFFPCPGAFATIVKALQNTKECRPRSDWQTLTFSFGMNGIVVQSKMVPFLKSFFLEKLQLKPPDWLIFEKWSLGLRGVGDGVGSPAGQRKPSDAS